MKPSLPRPKSPIKNLENQKICVITDGMALFGVKPSKISAAPLSAQPLPDAPDPSLRLIHDEYSPRVNVPAVALLGPRRVNLALPAPTSPPVADRRLIVAAGVSLEGQITECDALVVDGTLNATVGRAKQLHISAGGIFNGAANADTADIAGCFDGDLTVTHLRLRASAQFTGRVRLQVLEIEPGAQISGKFHYVAVSTGKQENANSFDFPVYPIAKRA